LRFYVLTFPTSRHTAIFSQIALSASDLSKKVPRKAELAVYADGNVAGAAAATTRVLRVCVAVEGPAACRA
jgi:hypothetical protein